MKTSRIKLRSLHLSDVLGYASKIVKWANDPEVREALKYFSFFQELLTLEKQRAYQKNIAVSETDRLYAIESTGSGNFIGTIGIHEIDWKNHNARLGIIIFNKNYWRQGYATETLATLLPFVFSEMKLNKIYLTARADNALAIHIYEKLGFTMEGILHEQYCIKENEYLDLIIMYI